MGAPLQGRVLIVDDVVSAGTSVRQSIDMINAAGAKAVGVAVALDRQEKGENQQSAMQELSEQYQLKTVAIACLDDLLVLLPKDNPDRDRVALYRNDRDRLFFLGDLVNRGGESLAVLRWVYSHHDCCFNVLGNHDFSLLHQYYLPKRRKNNREFRAIFAATDAALLMKWLVRQPLLIELPEAVLTHAGVYPLWDVDTQARHSDWAMSNLREHPKRFLKIMYGDEPRSWHAGLTDAEKWRFIVNVSTRMRFVDDQGRLEFTQKMATTKKKSLQPWFTLSRQNSFKKPIYFGHWSTLGLYRNGLINCLDSGCVWGGQLSAVRLQDNALFQVG